MIIIIISSIILIDKFLLTGETINQNSQHIERIPLSSEEREKVTKTLLASEFIEDVPKNNPIALQFYTFQDGERIWKDGFLIGKNQLLSEGEPVVFLYLHSKYIQEINNENLCEIIKKANYNGDLGFYSEYNKAVLLIKYVNMLKHRACFGI